MIVVIKYNIFKRKYVQRIELAVRVVTFVYSIGFKFMTKPIKKAKWKRVREKERKAHGYVNADMTNEYIFYVNSFPVITF